MGLNSTIVIVVFSSLNQKRREKGTESEQLLLLERILQFILVAFPPFVPEPFS